MNPYNTSVSGSSSQTEGLWSVIGQPSPGPRPPHPWGPSAASLAREAADADRTAVVLKGTIYLRPGPRPTTPPCHRGIRPFQPTVHHRPAVPATRPPAHKLLSRPASERRPPFGLTTSPMVSPLQPIPASPDLAR